MQKQIQKWSDETVYFLTSSTFLHTPYFKEDIQKEIILNQFRKIRDKFDVKISAYSILINHFHLKFFLGDGMLISGIKQILHGGTSYEYRKKFSSSMMHNDLWQSCRVYTVASESMDWKVTGYIIGNLLKHKEVNTFEELKDNRFSSYWYYVRKYGDDVAQELVRSVIDVDETNKGIVDMSGLGRAGAKAKALGAPAKAG